jgi:hypothetical protein
MDIPNVMLHRVNLLRVNLLSKLYDLVRSLIRHVSYNVLTFLLGGFQHPVITLLTPPASAAA